MDEMQTTILLALVPAVAPLTIPAVYAITAALYFWKEGE